MKMRIFLTLLIASSLLVSVFSKTDRVFADQPNFVRTANYFLLSGEALDRPETIGTLAEFDLIVIPLEAQEYNKSFFKTIREQNKDIIILAYVPTVSWNDLYWNDPIHQKLLSGIQSDWWLRDSQGNPVSIWPGTRALNLHSGWTDYISTFVRDEILSTNYWDGIFYDEVTDRNDWEQGYANIFAKTRSLVGEKPIIITNGSSKSAFAPYVNGRMFETFPSASRSLLEWKSSTNDYLAQEKRFGDRAVNVINVNTENTGVRSARDVRFGITTTLLGNGYFAFDFGTKDHSQLWTYDEYKVTLGKAKEPLTTAPTPSLPLAGEGVHEGMWQRNFERGRVLVNATDTEQTVNLDGDFEKIHGTQDRTVNDGSIVSEITLSARDGIILLRPIDQIREATFRNGAFARIFSANGKTKRTGFFAYEGGFRGGIQIVHVDYDHDGKLDTITADKTSVRVFDGNGTLHASFAPYTETYDRGVNIAVDDLEGDGTFEIVTGTLKGAGPHVRVFNTNGTLINPGFFAYEKNFRGGVNVAIGDLNGDKIKEIITGAAAIGGPHIRMFRKDGKLINPGFFAYDKQSRNGTYVASADLDNDGIDEVITGMGIGGAPEVRVFDRNGKVKSSFFAGAHTQRDGIKIAATDVDGDGSAEIITLTTDVFTLSGGK